MKEKHLKQVGWMLTGTAIVLLWGGGIATISMDKEIIEDTHEPTDKELVDHLNDGQFGVEKILGGEVDIHALYEQGFTEYERTTVVNANRGLSDKKLLEIIGE